MTLPHRGVRKRMNPPLTLVDEVCGHNPHAPLVWNFVGLHVKLQMCLVRVGQKAALVDVSVDVQTFLWLHLLQGCWCSCCCRTLKHELAKHETAVAAVSLRILWRFSSHRDMVTKSVLKKSRHIASCLDSATTGIHRIKNTVESVETDGLKSNEQPCNP